MEAIVFCFDNNLAIDERILLGSHHMATPPIWWF